MSTPRPEEEGDGGATTFLSTRLMTPGKGGQEETPSESQGGVSPRTVYSDVSHLEDDNVGFALRLRPSSRGASSALRSTFLPELMATPEESQHLALLAEAELFDDSLFEGCPEAHPDCMAREEKWLLVEERLERDE